jgi:hypothetical protein
MTSIIVPLAALLVDIHAPSSSHLLPFIGAEVSSVLHHRSTIFILTKFYLKSIEFSFFFLF